jgi:hypothetical protein
MKTLIVIAVVLVAGVAHAGCPGGVCSLKRDRVNTVETYSIEYVTSPVVNVAPTVKEHSSSNTIKQVSNRCSSTVVKNSVRTCRGRCRCR